MLLLLEVHELGLDHFNFLFFLFDFDALVIFLSSGQILLDNFHIVSVATEDTLIVHNIQSRSVLLIFFLVKADVVGGSLLVVVLLFAADDLGLCAIETLLFHLSMKEYF